jgi:protein tyrosine phosphatase (PTP) superfamily phosphohydrolase (DUF442 family)
MLPIILLQTFAQVAPAPPPPAAPQPSTKVNEVRPGLFTTGLMTYETLGSLKAMGVGTVLHLRPEKEAPSLPATERKAVELMGLRYIYSPVTPGFEDEEIDAFRKQMKGIDLKGGLMVHCFNSNRASGALLAYLVLDEKLPLDQALGLAHKGGLTMVKIENASRFYISRNGGPAYVEQKELKTAPSK